MKKAKSETPVAINPAATVTSVAPAHQYSVTITLSTGQVFDCIVLSGGVHSSGERDVLVAALTKTLEAAFTAPAA